MRHCCVVYIRLYIFIYTLTLTIASVNDVLYALKIVVGNVNQTHVLILLL